MLMPTGTTTQFILSILFQIIKLIFQNLLEATLLESTKNLLPFATCRMKRVANR
jgi:hypothetical protein